MDCSSQSSHYIYLGMLFGFTNAPAIIMNIMNSIFKDYLGVFTFGFMDDIFMFSKNRGGTCRTS